MWQGEIVSVHVGPAAGAAMTSPDEIQLITGRGVRGDRYCEGVGHFSHIDAPRRQLTLFESEVLETIRRDHNVDLEGHECRMNIVTKGVPLSQLVGVEFMVGQARVRGLQINEPCARLNEVTGKRVIKALIHRCGLFAEVLDGGVVRPGDIAASSAWSRSVAAGR